MSDISPESVSAETAPVVSVILATYRRPLLLGRAISSVVAQTFPDWELIVIDDEPGVVTAEIVSGFADPRIRLISHEVNLGLSAARNSGISAARSQLIGFLDDDDEYLPDKLRRQVHAFASGPDDLGVVSCFEEVVREGAATVVRGIELSGSVHHEILRDDLIRMQPLVVRRECFDRVGLFDTRLRTHDDFDMTLRLARAFTFVTVREPLVRIHADTHSMSNDDAACRDALWIMLDTHPDLRSPGRVRARWLRRIARHHAALGERSEWRSTMWRATRANPFSARTWVVLLAGLIAGPSVHQRLGRLRSKAVRW
jgi:glycosyltransferase involved in cell wall biosynthesis